MYEKLKQIMREAGYAVSEGVEWLAADMQHFVTFSRHVLGHTAPHLNHLLAYPEAFPHVMKKADELAGGATPATAETEDAEDATKAPSKFVPPAAAPQAEPAPQAPAESTFDVSAVGQTDKQVLNPEESAPQEPVVPPVAEQPSTESAPAVTEPSEGAQATEPAPAADQASAAESAAVQPNDTEGEQPKE